MRIRIKNWQFAPSLLMTILAAISCAIFFMLGSWQLERANIKRDIQSRYVERLQEPYQYMILGSELNESFEYRKILLKGGYRTDRVILVDNQINQGMAGYHVLVPFFVDNGRTAVLVNRGWVAAGPDRKVLPDIRDPKIKSQVEGIVTIPTTAGYRLGQVEMTGDWPQRVPYIDMQKIARGVDFELLPYVIWQAPEMDDYYIRDWKPVWSPPEKSEAYAMQWFSFAIIVIFLFILLSFKKISVGDHNE